MFSNKIPESLRVSHLCHMHLIDQRRESVYCVPHLVMFVHILGVRVLFILFPVAS